jgi:F-type H+-transporting ATPase subunit gamma
MAADFVSFFPETLPVPANNNTQQRQGTTDIYLLIGSERGFCGNFNDSLLPVLDSCITKDSESTPALIAVGHKLHTVLEADPRVIASINSANVTEEVESILTRVIDTIVNVLEAHPNSSLYVLYHSESHIGASIEGQIKKKGNIHAGDEHQILMKKLLPPFQSYLSKQSAFSHPPILNVPPADFLLQLTDHYLLAALHEILYTSLMAENHRRVQHLEGAVQHMDDKADELHSKCNALRQEEIIEEIEVILLSAESLM